MTELHNDVLHLFAVPGSWLEAEQRSRIESSLAMRVAVRSLNDAVSAVENREDLCPELFDTLAEWMSTKPVSWSREVGHLWRAVHYGELNATIGSLVANAIQANVSGVPSAWTFSLTEPKSIRVLNVVLNSVRGGSIEYSQGTFRGEFSLENGCVLLETVEGTCVVQQPSEGQERHIAAPAFDVMGDQYHLVPSLLASIDLLPPHGQSESEYDDGSVNATGVERLALALKALYQYSQEAYNWVSSVIREIIPMRSRKYGAGSTSSFWDCGTIAATLTNRPNSILLAEMLVHEASHQHFFLAKQLGPLDDGSDTREYYSPMVNASRPLEKMFLGYHALVNMLLFYKSVSVASDHDNDGLVLARIGYLFDKINTISPTISGSAAFTPQGDAMFQRLHEEEQRLRSYFSSYPHCIAT